MINDNLIIDEYSIKIIEDHDDDEITLELYLNEERSDHKSIENQLNNTINNSLLWDNENGSVNTNCQDIPVQDIKQEITEDFIELQKYVITQEQLNNNTPKKLNRSSIIIHNNNNNNNYRLPSTSADSSSQINFNDIFKEELIQIQSSNNFEAIRDGRVIKCWQCNLCKYKFKTKYLVKLHLKSHTNNHRPYICNLCDQGFSRLTQLQQHKSIHFERRSFPCSHCLKSYGLRSSLINHHKIHFTNTKQYSCSICNRSFHQQCNLNNHMNIHSEQSPYKCLDCTRGFNQMSNLTYHKEKFHPDKIDEPNWTCINCSATFSKRLQLRKHQLQVHQINKQKHSAIMDTGDVPVNDITNSNNDNILFVKQSVKRKLPFTTGKIMNKFQNNPPPRSTLPSQNLPINKINPNNRRILANVGLLIPLIKTNAMQIAKENNEMPFAVLHFLEGTQILVRCIEYYNGKNHLLRIATKSDFISLKTVQKQIPPTTDINNNNNNNNQDGNNNKISIPLIASIYQRCNAIGITEFCVEPPQDIYQFGKADNCQCIEQDEKKIRLFLNAVHQQKNLQKHTVRYNNQMFKQKQLRSLLKSNRTSQIIKPAINQKNINNTMNNNNKDILPKVITIPAIPEQTNWWNSNTNHQNADNNTFFTYTNNNNNNNNNDNDDDAIDLSETFTNIANGNYLSPKKEEVKISPLMNDDHSNKIIYNNAIVVPLTNATATSIDNNSFIHIINEINNNESMAAAISNDSINEDRSSNNCSTITTTTTNCIDTSLNNSNTFIDSMDSGYITSNNNSNNNNLFIYDDHSSDHINKELLLALVNAIESDGLEPDIEGIHKVFENVNKSL